MRSAVDNPFMPGADTVPRVWAGRLSQVRDWQDVVRPRRLAGLPERGRTILGEAGLGKSTLVRRIAAHARAQGDWVTPQLRLPIGGDPLRRLAGALVGLADQAGLATAREHRIGDVVARVRAISAAGVSVTMDPREAPEPYAVLTELLVAIGERALEADVCVLIHLDEVQNITDAAELSQVLICLGDALAHEVEVVAPGGVRLQRVLPIAVYLTGLPEFAEMTAASKGATFARRFATSTLAPIEAADLRLALHQFVTPGWEIPDAAGSTVRVRMEPEAAEAVVRLCCGEPFLFQLAGERAWYAGSGDVITRAEVEDGWRAVRAEALAHVERILDRLPPRERQVLETMAGLPPEGRTAVGIATAMGLRSASQIGPFAQRLDTVRGIIERGSPYRFRHRAIEAYLTSGWPAP
ncbi:ATP-binding protein [Nocardioides sp.]|uniref:ATP-binding protein n=1 Tax=Nocardioides sp. TaxID=35761 RepID=UPI0035154399